MQVVAKRVRAARSTEVLPEPFLLTKVRVADVNGARVPRTKTPHSSSNSTTFSSKRPCRGAYSLLPVPRRSSVGVLTPRASSPR
jgi:hypothetical protein